MVFYALQNYWLEHKEYQHIVGGRGKGRQSQAEARKDRCEAEGGPRGEGARCGGIVGGLGFSKLYSLRLY